MTRFKGMCVWYKGKMSKYTKLINTVLQLIVSLNNYEHQIIREQRVHKNVPFG